MDSGPQRAFCSLAGLGNFLCFSVCVEEWIVSFPPIPVDPAGRTAVARLDARPDASRSRRRLGRRVCRVAIGRPGAVAANGASLSQTTPGAAAVAVRACGPCCVLPRRRAFLRRRQAQKRASAAGERESGEEGRFLRVAKLYVGFLRKDSAGGGGLRRPRWGWFRENERASVDRFLDYYATTHWATRLPSLGAVCARVLQQWCSRRRASVCVRVVCAPSVVGPG